MELIENKDGTSNLINSIAHDKIIINGVTIKESCIVTNHALLTNINIHSIENLANIHIEHLLSTNPELILIGSGPEHVFPKTDLLTPVAKKNIGLEVMNNHSATITYNVLVAEERKVACLLII